jgi:nucleoside-diphosphate-sugar epimerase
VYKRQIHYGGAYLDRVLIFRPHNVYGPDMGTEHVVPQFALRMAQTFAEHPQDPAPFRLQGTGEETRAFVYIDDFIEGLLCVLERGQHLNTYHIGTDVETRIADLAHAVAACFGRTIRLETGEAPAGGTPRRCPDIRKVAALGYAPRISLAEGLARTVAWYRQSLSPSQESS